MDGEHTISLEVTVLEMVRKIIHLVPNDVYVESYCMGVH